MSFISSGRKSSTPSILKKPGRPRSFSGHSVKFQLDHNLKSLLLSYINEKNRDAYVELIHKIKDAGERLSDDELVEIISQAKDCLSILNEELRLFVQVILLLKWIHRGDEAVQQYKNFVLDLCSAHNYYTQFTLQQLVSTFSEVNTNSFHQVCYPSEQEEKGFQNAHEVIKSILKLIPMSKNVLLTRIKRKFPFRTESARIHLNFVHNILTVCCYEPFLRREILVVLFTKLIHLDTMCSKQDIEKSENCINVEIKDSGESVFPMEVDGDLDTDEDMKNETARKLDFCIHRTCKYIYAECHDKNDTLKWEKVKNLYQDLLFVFETVIIPTCGPIHLPFLMLYFISFKRKLTEDFINYLWNKVINMNVAGVIRQSAVYYLSGLLSHASFVSLSIVKTMMQNMALWLHNYINTTNCVRDGDTNTFIRIHAVFYATSQALFYLINARHRDLVCNDKNLKCLENLNLGKIVSCSLNPLLVCNPSIVNYFARVTHKYQLTYCFTLLNGCEMITAACSDGWLDGCFPFDSFLLKRSKEIVKPIHRPIEDLFDKELPENNASEVDDDFMSGSLSLSPHVPVLGSSPFFGCISG